MASTITTHAEAPGKGRFTPPLMNTPRVPKIRTFDLNITSYAAGGEDVSSIANEFQQVLMGLVQDPTGGRVGVYDQTNKKVMAFQTGAALSGVLAETAAATNVGVVRVMLIGY